MAHDELVARLTALFDSKATEAGMELVALEVAGAQAAPIVRVYLDREGGIDIDAIASANVWIKEVLDELPETADRYTLEVSSPGIERPLRTRADFERFAGSQAKVTSRELIDGRKSFTGTLAGVQGETILVEMDGTTYTIPLGAIDKARLRVEIDFNKEGLDGI
ncbi:MAG: ribosome maturation factor RimP [Coriobacteriia bacterium]|nr:ribosome maturation factor RimP [Coriobacteriia bacterium]